MARQIGLAAALLALATGLTATSAPAHEGSPNYESLVRGVTPRIAGFTVEVLNGDDRLAVQNAGASTITIDGYNTEPYLRLSPGGEVEVNLRSPAHYLNQDRFYGAKVPDSADAKLAPQWKLVARTGRYEFHDHRMHYMGRNVPQQVTDESKRTKVFDWSVPVRAQSTTGAIRGQLFWRGADSGAPVGAYAALGVLVLLGGGSVLLVRRRRSRGAARGATPAAPRGEAW